MINQILIRINRSFGNSIRRIYFMNKIIVFVATVSLFAQIIFGGYANQPVSAKEAVKKSGRPVDADDLLVVDCLLPGKLKKLGNMSYLAGRLEAVASNPHSSPTTRDNAVYPFKPYDFLVVSDPGK